MVVSDVEARKKQNYGYTAKQIAVKIELDKTATPIIPHLLKGINPIELERLLLRILPERYIELMSSSEAEPDPSVLANLSICYRNAFDAADKALRRKTLQRVVSVVKENDGLYVQVYERAFFEGFDLTYLDGSDREVVRCHLLGQLKSDPSLELLRARDGIFSFLTDAEIDSYTRSLLGIVAAYKDRHTANKASEILTSDYFFAPLEREKLIKQTVDRYVESYKKRDSGLVLERLKDIRVVILKAEDIPF